jgi:hypothetical protein
VNHRLGIANPFIRLEQHHHGQHRRRHWRRAARLVDRGQFCLKRVVEQLGADLAQEYVEFPDAVQHLGDARLIGCQLSRTGPANRCRHAVMRSHADPDIDPLT